MDNKSMNENSGRRRRRKSWFKRVVKSREFLWIVLAALLAFGVAHFIVNRSVGGGEQVVAGGN